MCCTLPIIIAYWSENGVRFRVSSFVSAGSDSPGFSDTVLANGDYGSEENLVDISIMAVWTGGR